MSQRRPGTIPGLKSVTKSRSTARRDEIVRQEQLLAAKRKEVEAKLLQANASSTVTGTAGTSDVGPIGALIPVPEMSVSVPGNKFQNNGSFLDMFRAIQKQKVSEKTAAPEMGETEELKECQSKSVPQLVPGTDMGTNIDAIEKCATFIAITGPEQKETLMQRFNSYADYQWLRDKDCKDYKFFEKRIAELQFAKGEADGAVVNVVGECDLNGITSDVSGKSEKRRKSRWGSASDVLPMDADLVQYAIQVFGTVQLEERQWRQLKDQRNMRILSQVSQKRKMSVAEKYEYDSDEDVDGGTWEHKRRLREMQQTKDQSLPMTQSDGGKHFLGDYLPPDELSQFLHRWQCLKEGKPFDQGSGKYEQFRLTSSNVGFKMLEQMGWSEGQGLGANEGSGIVEPVACQATSEQRGLGSRPVADLKEGDDEFEAYRKRMMLAYRFRPNPLNNPRRSYY